jgi:hypothetical protein
MDHHRLGRAGCRRISGQQAHDLPYLGRAGLLRLIVIAKIASFPRLLNVGVVRILSGRIDAFPVGILTAPAAGFALMLPLIGHGNSIGYLPGVIDRSGTRVTVGLDRQHKGAGAPAAVGPGLDYVRQ